MFENILNEIEKSESILIISHINPDGDTCGSALAMYLALKQIGKDVAVVCDSDFNTKLSVLPSFDAYNKYDENKKYDLYIAVDCSDELRLGKFQNAFLRAKSSVCIDHHGTNTKFAKLNYVNTNAAANCENIYKLLCELDSKTPCLNKEIGICLYSGIITDSGNFMNNNTTHVTKQIAQEIEERFDLNTGDIVNHFMNEVSYDVFMLKTRVLAKAKFYDNNTIGIIYFSQEDFKATNTSMPDTEGIINEIRNVDTVKIAVAVTQKNDIEYKVSLRSVPTCRVDRLAASFGGGGHPVAAGFSIQGNFYDVMERILKACRDYVE